MDHKRFLAALDPQTKAALQKQSNAVGLHHLALHVGAIIAMGSYISADLALWPLLVPIQGVFIAFLFSLTHECTHRTPFCTPWINEVVGRICGCSIGLPFLWFRFFHLAHHTHTNDPVRDPELDGKGRPGSPLAYIWYLTGWPFLRANAAVIVRNGFGPARDVFVPPSAHRRLRREACAMLMIYSVIAAAAIYWSLPIVSTWILPLLIGLPTLRFFLLAEHGLCPQVADMFDNTRTTYTSRFVQWLSWNMSFHTEHHVMPSVPQHQLPALNAIMRDHLRHVSFGYPAFHNDFAKSVLQRQS